MANNERRDERTQTTQSDEPDNSDNGSRITQPERPSPRPNTEFVDRAGNRIKTKCARCTQKWLRECDFEDYVEEGTQPKCNNCSKDSCELGSNIRCTRPGGTAVVKKYHYLTRFYEDTGIDMGLGTAVARRIDAMCELPPRQTPSASSNRSSQPIVNPARLLRGRTSRGAHIPRGPARPLSYSGQRNLQRPAALAPSSSPSQTTIHRRTEQQREGTDSDSRRQDNETEAAVRAMDRDPRKRRHNDASDDARQPALKKPNLKRADDTTAKERTTRAPSPLAHPAAQNDGRPQRQEGGSVLLRMMNAGHAGTPDYSQSQNTMSRGDARLTHRCRAEHPSPQLQDLHRVQPLVEYADLIDYNTDSEGDASFTGSRRIQPRSPRLQDLDRFRETSEFADLIDNDTEAEELDENDPTSPSPSIYSDDAGGLGEVDPTSPPPSSRSEDAQ